MTTYYVGETARLTTTFGDPPADPAAVSVAVGLVGETPTTYVYGVDAGVLRDGVGLYAVLVPLISVGTWLVTWTGDAVAQPQTAFDVATAPPAYASLDQLRAALRLDDDDEIDETELLRCLQDASREIDGEVSRRSLGTVTRFYDDADWPTVPAPISRACTLLAIALYKRSQAVFGVLQSTLDGSPIQVGKDFHVDALITSVVPWALTAL